MNDTQHSTRKRRRIRKIDVRYTEEEYTKIIGDIEKSPYATKGDYVRAQLLNAQITELEAIRHQAYIEVSKLKDEIRRIGTNFNQLVHAINTYKEVRMTEQDRRFVAAVGKVLLEVRSKLNSLEI